MELLAAADTLVLPEAAVVAPFLLPAPLSSGDMKDWLLAKPDAREAMLPAGLVLPLPCTEATPETPLFSEVVD